MTNKPEYEHTAPEGHPQLQKDRGESLEHEELLNKLRSEVPRLRLSSVFDENQKRVFDKIKSKISSFLAEDKDTEEKRVVAELISNVIAQFCLAYEINPAMLIMLPSSLGSEVIASASTSEIEGFMMHKLHIDPFEIMFRVDLLSRFGIESAENITNIIFVLAHEMVHFGQDKYCKSAKSESKKFDYKQMPIEIHADEQALAFLEELFTLTEADETINGRNILLEGLPKTISEAKENQRPRM